MSPLDKALALASIGLHVHPCKQSDKSPYLEHGHHDASTDHALVAEWWTRWPDALVGVSAGASGLFVIDIDVDPEKGVNGWESLYTAELAPLPETYSYKTRRGGNHYVYTAPSSVPLDGAANLRDGGDGERLYGVDRRGGSSYFIWWPEEVPDSRDVFIDAAPLRLSYPATEGFERSTGAEVSEWSARIASGKAAPEVKAVLSRFAPNGMSHEDMFAAVGDMVRLGSQGYPGVAKALGKARATYLQDYPEYAKRFDDAVRDQVDRKGMPPTTFAIRKAEKKQLKARAEGKAASPQRLAGSRTLEDGPLALEITDLLAGKWAWTKPTGLLRYTGKVWELAEMQSLVEAVRSQLDAIEIEEHALATSRQDKQAIGKALTLLSRNRARAVTDLVLGLLMEARLTADDHPDLMNVQNGVVDLRTGALSPHDPALLFTKIAATGYDPEAESADWTKALEAIPGKVVPWLQVRFGQAATGRTVPDAEVLFLQGGGENGKSAILNGVRTCLGDYATDVPEKVLTANAGDHPTEMTTLMGVRFAISEELPQGHTLNTKRLKDIAGTPVITARKMRQDFVSWRATHTLFVTTNHEPIVTENDHGTWRRLLLVRFPYKFRKPGQPLAGRNDRRADMGLRDRLGDDPNPAILTWVIQGAMAWYAADRTMPPVPKRVEKDTRAWRFDADPVMKYVEERLELSETSAIWVHDLLSDFNDWQSSEGLQTWSARTVAARFAGHESLPNVEKKTFRDGLIAKWSRIPGRLKKPPQRGEGWVGVKFKDADEGGLPPSREAGEFERITSSLR